MIAAHPRVPADAPARHGPCGVSGGNKAICDPIVLVMARVDDQPADETFTGVPQAESRVTITNGNPGMRKVQLIVNR